MRIGNTKVVSYPYSARSIKALEKYLEHMALKGWILKNGSTDRLIFKKSEPGKIKYYVDILDRLTVLDLENSDTFLEYKEICEASGWELISRAGKVLIFKADNEEAIPIHTDETEEFEIIKKAGIKTNIIIILFLMLIAFIGGGNIFTRYGVNIISNNMILIAAIALVLAIIYQLIEIICFYRWNLESKKNLLINEPVKYEKRINKIIPQYMIPRIIGIALNLLLIAFAFMYSYSISKYGSLLYVVVLTLIIGTPINIQHIKSICKLEKDNNLKSIALISVGLMLVINLSAAVIGYSTQKNRIERINAMEKPLDLDDFNDVVDNDYPEYAPNDEFNKGILGEYLRVIRQGENNRFSYSLFKSDIHFLIEYYGEKYIETDLEYYAYEPLDTNLPEEVEVYENVRQNRCDYLIISEDKILTIEFWETQYSEEELLEMIYEKIF